MSDRASGLVPDKRVSSRPVTWPLSAREAAELLGVNERTIRRAISRGEIHADKWAGSFRIYPDELERYRARKDADHLARLPLPTLSSIGSMPSRPASSPAPLPQPVTSFVGRESEIEAARRLVERDDVRLVTLTGPGGVGKTRLAVAVAAATPAFPDGVRVVGLAPIRDAGRVADTIARSLGLRSRSQRSFVERLAPALSGRKALLVLDNFEHVIEAAPRLADVLQAFPMLTILVTSRSRLRISGEHEYIVPPLGLDVPANVTTAGNSDVSEAARLFMTRAEAAGASMPRDPATVDIIQRICQRLEGLPLAIELAAVRLKVISPDVLLERLGRRMPLLTGGGRDLPERQKTMRATIAWSYNLLSPDGQTLFRHLSVFSGGISLMAAEYCAQSICSDGGVPLDVITELVDASLLREMTGSRGLPRYHMLETMREYGQGLLDHLGEARAARDAHAAFFLDLNVWLEPNTLTSGVTLDDRLLEIDSEQPNIDAALQHLADTGEARGALHLAANCAVAWHHLGYLPEGRHWLEYALANAPDEAVVDRGMALAGLALIRWTQVDLSLGTIEAQEALAIGRQTGNPRLLALSQHMLGVIGILHERWDEAESWLEKAYGAWQAIGDRSSGAMALLILGDVAFGRGDMSTSREMTDQSLRVFHAIGHSPGEAFGRLRYASIAQAEGKSLQALQHYQVALPLLVSALERWAISKALAGIAGIAVVFGQYNIAATLVGAIDAKIEQIGSGMFPQDRENYNRAAVQARKALGSQQYSAYYAAGRSMALQEVVALASSVTIATDLHTRCHPESLSAREREVLDLLVDGRSNAEIARELFISIRTARAHVANILAKLGVPTRTAAAVYAIRNNLS